MDPPADESILIHMQSNIKPIGDRFENDLPFDDPAYEDSNKSFDEDLNIKSRSPSRPSTASSNKRQRSESPPRQTRSWLPSNSRSSYHEVYRNKNYYLDSTVSRRLWRDTHRREQRQRTPPRRRSAYKRLDTRRLAYSQLDGQHRPQPHNQQRNDRGRISDQNVIILSSNQQPKWFCQHQHRDRHQRRHRKPWTPSTTPNTTSSSTKTATRCTSGCLVRN